MQELIHIHFNVSLLYEDNGINSLQTYIQKMNINANLEVYGMIIVPYFVWQIIYIGPSMFGQKQIV
jgi:hypothetical protein